MCRDASADISVAKFRVTTCLENLEVLGNLTAVREISWI